ncbi:SRPBCC family protein [Rhizobacter sp. J219]|uniref:SRPBCC family protein n=1 Tax=Rhizobacter sp. J219 TaxID=2898430 RepID=UPI0021507F30|nr:SRPBCC family protein [Rhizobacter sp. J219]MCR5884425.1 SRPBCC family protein [Rhizobacter sp. J219]
MLKKILLGLVVIVAAVLLFALTKPDSFSVERSATIKAPPEKIYPLISDFHQWPQWSPWEKLDPNMKRSLSGAPQGVGAVYAWTGNDDVGEGRMEITGATPPTQVNIKLDFIKPFASQNTTVFTLTPQGDGTRVKWVMQGPAPYITKLMTVFVSMDKMVGSDFEKGLSNMKAAAER